MFERGVLWDKKKKKNSYPSINSSHVRGRLSFACLFLKNSKKINHPDPQVSSEILNVQAE